MSAPSICRSTSSTSNSLQVSMSSLEKQKCQNLFKDKNVDYKTNYFKLNSNQSKVAVNYFNAVTGSNFATTSNTEPNRLTQLESSLGKSRKQRLNRIHFSTPIVSNVNSKEKEVLKDANIDADIFYNRPSTSNYLSSINSSVNSFFQSRKNDLDNTENNEMKVIRCIPNNTQQHQRKLQQERLSWWKDYSQNQLNAMRRRVLPSFGYNHRTDHQSNMNLLKPPTTQSLEASNQILPWMLPFASSQFNSLIFKTFITNLHQFYWSNFFLKN